MRGMRLLGLHPQGDLEARFTVALPARGRTVLGNWAAQILVSNLPRQVITRSSAPSLQVLARPCTAAISSEDF